MPNLIGAGVTTAWRKTAGGLIACAAGLIAAAPAAGQASWICRADGGWIASGGDRVNALRAPGEECSSQRVESPAATAGSSGRIVFAKPVATTGGAAPGVTTDAHKPKAEVTADSVAIENADGSFRLTARSLRATAEGSCSAARKPALATSGGTRDVMLNGRPIPNDREFSETGVGVNGVPLFGRVRIRFDQLVRDGDVRVARRAIEVQITDRDGALVLAAAVGEVAVGRSGDVCVPPPVCAEGQRLDPAGNRCVEVDVVLPPTPDPVPPLPPGTTPPAQPQRGCPGAERPAAESSAAALRAATMCLVNRRRSQRKLRRLRVNAQLEAAARRHARDMVVRRYFAHQSPGGAGIVQRLLRTTYLRRYGNWRVGEVIGWGWGARSSASAIVESWMRSPAHRRQLMGDYRDFGVGVQRAAPTRTRRKAATWVVTFGKFG